MQTAKRFVLSGILAAISFVGCAAACNAQATPSPSPSPLASASPAALPSASPSASAVMVATPAPEGGLYDMADEIFSIFRDATAYYYFQGNNDGSAKVKQELRYGRNLWNDFAQIRIRLPIITKFPTSGNPYSGFGNAELGYSYNVKAPKFDHSLEIRAAFPTNANNVDNKDTELKGFYTVKWKWSGGAVSYMNEYDQSVIKPPNATWTSYYEGKLTAPDFKFAPGVKISAIYNFRVLFDSGGTYKPALGATVFGDINDVALAITDSWGVGANPLWKFKLEANATAKF